MNLYHDTFDTAFGPFSVAFDATGALVASAFGPLSTLERRLRPLHAIPGSRTSGCGALREQRDRSAHASRVIPALTRRATRTFGNFGIQATREIAAPRSSRVHPDGFHVIRETRPAHPVRDQVRAYCAGERREFALPLAPRGTAFQLRVWSALREIPFGSTQSYSQLAATIGDRRAARAIGRANATNPLCLFIPCHRVIGADGSLTGFAFGERLKRELLAHEAAVLERSSSRPFSLAAC